MTVSIKVAEQPVTSCSEASLYQRLIWPAAQSTSLGCQGAVEWNYETGDWTAAARSVHDPLLKPHWYVSQGQTDALGLIVGIEKGTTSYHVTPEQVGLWPGS